MVYSRVMDTLTPSRTPDRIAQSIQRALTAAQARHALFPALTGVPHPVVVAVSGGLDSVCLLHALMQVAPAWGLDLHVAHLDHALRRTSADDAAWVRDLAQAHGLPVYERRLADDALTAAPDGVEAAARRARYAFLAAVACQIGHADAPATVVTAHHQDDQAETVLMRLLSGSGIDGLAGMAWVTHLADDGAVSPDGPIRLVRPLLAVSRADLQDYAQAHGLSWREDSSNADRKHLRNRVRHDVLPRLATINPAAGAALARSADLLALEADRAAQWDRAALDAAAIEQSPAQIVLARATLATAHPATQRGVLRMALSRLGADLREVGQDHVEAILDRLLAQPGAGGPYPLPGGLAWTMLAAPPALSLHRAVAPPVAVATPQLMPGARIELRTTRQLTVVPNWELVCNATTVDDLPTDWRSRDAVWTATLDADAACDLLLTTPAPGMRLAPLGMHGHQRTLGDIFTDRKVAPALRPGWPVVVHATTGEVVWLCGVTISHTARVTAATRRVVRLIWQRSAADAA